MDALTGYYLNFEYFGHQLDLQVLKRCLFFVLTQVVSKEIVYEDHFLPDSVNLGGTYQPKRQMIQEMGVETAQYCLAVCLRSFIFDWNELENGVQRCSGVVERSGINTHLLSLVYRVNKVLLENIEAGVYKRNKVGDGLRRSLMAVADIDHGFL